MYKSDENKRGRIFSANISSDSTGIGTWPPEVFMEVIRTGKAGTLDAKMPWQAFKNMNDEDLTAILAFLKTTVPVAHLIAKEEPPTWCEVCEQHHGSGDSNHIKPFKPFDPAYVIPWDIAGQYTSEDMGISFSIAKVGNQWMVSTSRRQEILQAAIIPVSETKFFADGFPTFFTFEVNAQGRVSGFNFMGVDPQRFQKKN